MIQCKETYVQHKILAFNMIKYSMYDLIKYYQNCIKIWPMIRRVEINRNQLTTDTDMYYSYISYVQKVKWKSKRYKRDQTWSSRNENQNNWDENQHLRNFRRKD